MTKASDPTARPEVAKKDADQVSDLYDFVKSPEWQEVLENARKQRAVNQAARKKKAQAAQQPEKGRSKAGHSTARAKSPKEPNKGSIQPEVASKLGDAAGAGRTGESVQKPTQAQDGDQNVKASGKVAGTAGASLGARNQNRKRNLADQSNLEHPQPAPGQDTVHETQEDQSDQAASEPNSKPSADAVADRLRKTLFKRSADQKRTRRKMRLGPVAVGCAIGVAASSSVFLVLSEWTPSGPTESAGLASENTEVTSIASRQDTEFDQSDGLQSELPRVADGQAVLPATGSDTSLHSFSPDTDPVDPSETESLVSLTQPLSGSAESEGGVEPDLLRLAPNVQSFVPTLAQPPLTINLISYRPRADLNLGFVRFQTTPEIFGTSVALLEEAVAATVSIEPTAELTAVAPRRAPIVPTQPDAIVNAGSKVTGEVAAAIPKQASAYQPEKRGSNVRETSAVLSLPEVMAALEIEEPPAVRVLIDPNASGLRTVSIEPMEQPEETGLPPVITEPKQAKPQSEKPDSPILSATLVPPDTSAPSDVSEPLETLAPDTPVPSEPSDTVERTALLDDPIEPSEPAPVSGQAAFRLYAPNSLSADTVNSVVTTLTTTGHELSGTARVGFGISQSNVRFYHKQDEATAAALAQDAGALLRDFTGAATKTPSGIIELWLAGKGSGGVAVQRTAKRSRAKAPAANRVNRLRSQVLSKLKNATNQ
ncbi:hypothetical protein [Ruegeria sp. Ofav3-42]|uniref:hypothetical protein n=1 Tax=Ruegeria sp. Ofav3-42 TaxID=2917759 RepID=UPI001EF4F89B|nr:hypothetical protein [Ruegeria sp. Ofav3-42]MCG7519808.1 hypothetical protein [Ruegeria sp. Ofav3-42]